mmetsp:Transcript_11994/g.19825  ORF Transcript_11994/g.19825 Transcript_11994/m.19825 type:complete len:221 (-) Transcript_11994:1986-2648(-)
MSRYFTALGEYQDLNTACTAMFSCSQGSAGTVAIFLNSFTTSTRSAMVRRLSWGTPRFSRATCSTSSYSCLSTPRTTLPNICRKRRYVSNAQRGLLLILASTSTISSLIPRFSIVSIMPGIDTAAPERTDSSRGGFNGCCVLKFPPNCFPVCDSISCTPLVYSATKSLSSSSSSCLKYSRQDSAVITKAGGTGIPRRYISHRFAPLLPRTLFSSIDPSFK